jgi:hypothetical protein
LLKELLNETTIDLDRFYGRPIYRFLANYFFPKEKALDFALLLRNSRHRYRKLWWHNIHHQTCCVIQKTSGFERFLPETGKQE